MLGDRHTYLCVCVSLLPFHLHQWWRTMQADPGQMCSTGTRMTNLQCPKLESKRGRKVCSYDSGWFNGDCRANMSFGWFLPEYIHQRWRWWWWWGCAWAWAWAQACTRAWATNDWDADQNYLDAHADDEDVSGNGEDEEEDKSCALMYNIHNDARK